MLSRTADPAPRPHAIARWLLVLAAMVFVMVVVGGITRLTESGLSMTRWEPVSGTVPPLDAADWQVEFDAYRATPEYLKVNSDMTLDQFKRIFFWEYLHRLIGRLIGVAFALPFAWFLWKRAVPPGYGPRLTALFLLGGLQGVIGWWMVASGLVDRPDVSHVRLAIHLSAALFIMAGLVWTALDLRANGPARMPGIGIVALAALAIQIILGAFVAGLDAGYAFNSWPRMGSEWFPDGGWQPRWTLFANLIDNPIVVQFAHRWFAWIAAAAAVTLGLAARRKGISRALPLIALAIAAQIGLGIMTLLSGMALPIAAAHQAMGALLLLVVVWAAHRLGSMTA